MAVVNASDPSGPAASALAGSRRDGIETSSASAPSSGERPAACAPSDSVALTPGRQRILNELRDAGAPLGAYELMERFGARDGKRPAPISVYRALDFLVDHGLVHRLSSRSAFLACSAPHAHSEAVVFLICDACGSVTETPSSEVAAQLSSIARQNRFRADLSAVELVGRCAACSGQAASIPSNQ